MEKHRLVSLCTVLVPSQVGPRKAVLSGESGQFSNSCTVGAEVVALLS